MNQVFLTATIIVIATLSLAGIVATSSVALAQPPPEKAKLPAEQNTTITEEQNATNTTITEGVSPNVIDSTSR